MARPVALRAVVVMSRPEHRLVVGNQDGPVTDWPEWVSLDVQVQFDLDDGARVSTEQAKWQRGGTLACSRAQLNDDIRKLVLSQPRYPPGQQVEPALVVEELQHHGVDSTIETLAALPFSVVLAHEVSRTGGPVSAIARYRLTRPDSSFARREAARRGVAAR